VENDLLEHDDEVIEYTLTPKDRVILRRINNDQCTIEEIIGWLLGHELRIYFVPKRYGPAIRAFMAPAFDEDATVADAATKDIMLRCMKPEGSS
jgi:hypothetical protein